MLHSRHDSIPIWILLFRFSSLIFAKSQLTHLSTKIKSQTSGLFSSIFPLLVYRNKLIFNSTIGIGNRNWKVSVRATKALLDFCWIFTLQKLIRFCRFVGFGSGGPCLNRCTARTALIWHTHCTIRYDGYFSLAFVSFASLVRPFRCVCCRRVVRARHTCWTLHAVMCVRTRLQYVSRSVWMCTANSIGMDTNESGGWMLVIVLVCGLSIGAWIKARFQCSQWVWLHYHLRLSF